MQSATGGVVIVALTLPGTRHPSSWWACPGKVEALAHACPAAAAAAAHAPISRNSPHVISSGSTLIEQILASHSSVWGAGEDTRMAPLVTHIIQARAGRTAAADGGERQRHMLLLK